MSTPTLPGPKPTPSGQQRPVTREEFWQLYDQGTYTDRRVELIDGEIVEMAAQSNLHNLAVEMVKDALTVAFGPSYWVRSQGSLDLTPLSVPDPDISVVPGSRRSYLGRRDNPVTAVLIVEVSDATLWEDRNRKASLYAAAGITDYWILNIPDMKLEIRRVARPDQSQDFGFSYASLSMFVAGDVVSPLAAPTAQIPVADLLPV